MYAILDIESTGGKYNEESITQIAIYKLDGKKIIDQISSLVNPDKNIQPLTSEISHFISYFQSPSDCITGYNHTKNVIKILEEYYKT